MTLKVFSDEHWEEINKQPIFFTDIKKERVDHPKHYNDHPSGVECIDIIEAFTFNTGNAIKYLWRAGLKEDELEDLKKALWYVQREIDRRG